MLLPNIAPDYLSKSPYLGLMLDYDGTLAPIVSHPEEAFLEPETLNLLKRLAQVPTIRLAIVSGRSIKQLEAFLNGLSALPIVLCGLHGGEIRQYPESLALRMPSTSIRNHVRHFKARLIAALQAKELLKDVFLEDKTYSIALHYRLTPVEKKESAVQCFELLYKNSESLQASFRMQPGKEVLELVPATFDKGSCVQFLARAWQQALPDQKLSLVYAGDDLTDEHAFETVRHLQGHGILISESQPGSKATMRIDSMDLFYQALESLLLSVEQDILSL